ncbi:sugar ABC transporter substrate-binding protein, partial [Streptomyces sp. SID11233]|nr:sugar ABC transporter substrate-binding protein [Streptomyces sp. SID11233]
MRRGIAATALLASLALAATACGGDDGDDGASGGGPVTLTWWDTSNATNEAPTYK